MIAMSSSKGTNQQHYKPASCIPCMQAWGRGRMGPLFHSLDLNFMRLLLAAGTAMNMPFTLHAGERGVQLPIV